MKVAYLAIAVVVAGALACPASAKNYDVRMLNRGQASSMVFEPALIRIAPGDTVTFVAADKGHNVESIAGAIPAGAAPFAAGMNQNLTVKLVKPGVYGFKCVPHYGMGMVGAVVVGQAVNLEAAGKVTNPGRARLVFAGLLETIEHSAARR